MKKSFSFLLSVLLIAALITLQTSCEVEVKAEVSGSGSASGEWDASDPGSFNGQAKGEIKGSVTVSMKFSPKPTVFDEAFIIDFNKSYAIIDNNIEVTISVNTDNRFSKNAKFTFTRNPRLRIIPILKNANSHVFTPANKTLLDKFIKEVLANTNHLATANISFKAHYKGQLVKAKSPFGLTKNDIAIRAKFLPNQQPVPVKIENVNVPMKLISIK